VRGARRIGNLRLAFHPPVWYRDWVESRSAAEAA